jgi:anion-transporting  ArsA/GET3 family ATPase
MGPVRQQADSVMNLLRSRRTAEHLVTVLEEMPVQETVDGVAELTKAGLPVGAIVINMVRDPLLPADALTAAAAGEVDTAEITRGLKATGIDDAARYVEGLADEVSEHAGRVLLEEREREVLGELSRPMYELPLLTEAVDLSCLYELAARLAEQGMP